MKRSFMNNLKNFVDSNVRHRIDRASHQSGNINNNSESSSDDLLIVERHFDDIRLFCIDAEKKISNMLQSIQLSSNASSNLGAYTQNVQAGLNNLSHNIAQQAANITSSAASISGSAATTHDIHTKNLANKESKSTTLVPNQGSKSAQQYLSDESLGNTNHNQRSHSQNTTIHPNSVQATERYLNGETLQRYKKLPMVGIYKFLGKSSKKMKQDSLLAVTLTHYSQLQVQLTNLYLSYEQKVDSQCLKTIQHLLETEIPNVLKLKKSSQRAHNDLESLRVKYNIASQKQQQQQQQVQQQTSSSGHFTNAGYSISQNSTLHGNKLEQLKNELDEAVTRFEQARDVYEAELFGFVCREPELVNLMKTFYHLQAEYHRKVSATIQSASPSLADTLARTPRKFAFGTHLDEHLRCTGRTISPVIELCTHFLHSQALKEEGLFRIPGSSIKIKKLKNAINAWFVTLVNLDELESDQVRQTGHNCIPALHDLFKSAIGQRPHLQPRHLDAPTCDESVQASHSSSCSNDNQQSENNNDEYILDVHSIAGLLKLYLRELPEPLFTYALYDDWIACVTQETDSSSAQGRLENFAHVLKQLPESNYANLKHLIKFLNHLTLFQEHNKMTSTNLAIAMAPSLIWSKPLEQEETHINHSVSSSEEAHSLNLQMCSFGMSASQHATILEALINNADQLFPEQSDFTLAEFANLSLKCRTITSKRDAGRSVKSTSPTGLSTASSSSFSSNASNSTASSQANKGHNRKGGSMEGLLAGPQELKSIAQPNMSIRSAGRPVSVQIRRDDYASLAGQNPGVNDVVPAKPPPPNARTRSKPASTLTNNEINTAPLSSSHKSRAPPVPPPTSIRHQQERLKAIRTTSSGNNQEHRMPRPVSLRGTGTIDVASPVQSGSTNQAVVSVITAARPSVPPPERPATSAPIRDATKQIAPTDRECKSADDTDTKSSQSLTSSGNMRGDFEEISANEVDEIELSTQSNSPVVSLDSISGDSSFDNENDNTSLDRPWTKCFSAKQTGFEQQGQQQQQQEQAAVGLDSRSGTLKMIVRDLAHDQSTQKQQQQQQQPTDKSETKSISADKAQGGDSDGHTQDSGILVPPKKSSAEGSVSKITQSTPL